MPGLLEVTAQDIRNLNQVQLTDVLRRLLLLEATTCNIPASSVSVSMNITAPDGGEDGRICWKDGLDRTDWFPDRFTLFQCKACSMSPFDCANEVLTADNKHLKSQIEKVFDAGGSYVVFCREQYNTKARSSRIEAIRKVLREVKDDRYADDAKIEFYDGDRISNWVNEHLASIAAVLESTRRAQLSGLQTWGMWSRYKDNQFSYVVDDGIADGLATLRGHFSQAMRVARIVGLSGLGKTRLALEAFRPPSTIGDNKMQQTLSDSVVYINAATSAHDLVAVVIEWRRQNLQGLLVVDDCELGLHQQLAREIEHSDSRLSLLTLDFDPDKSGADCPVIKMQPASENVIKGILAQGYPGLADHDLDHIVAFADGFPKMAVLIAKARLDGASDALSLRDPVTLGRLLWGRTRQNDEANKVIQVCALFEQLGFTGIPAEQREYAAENLCGMGKEDFYGHAQQFLNRGILTKRGNYVRVVPLPLALRLAEQWWTECTKERQEAILTQDMPPGMSDAIADRFAHLDYLDDAQDIVASLCSDAGPFSKAEVFDSERGSRLFRSLVEVNPKATCNALSRAFGRWSEDQIREVHTGRRNIVHALEKLCFWENTFPTAGRLLLAFAAGENETWANNATGQFLQLYQMHLAGTQAPPALRLSIVDEALKDDSLSRRRLAIEALGKALNSHHYFRHGGVEQQGSRPSQRDWEPKTYGDMYNYWREALNRLLPLACADGELSDLARIQISNAIRGLVGSGLWDDTERVLMAVAEAHGGLWPEALQAVYNTLRFDSQKYEIKHRERLESWVRLLQPESLADRLRLIVSSAPHDPVKGDDGRYIETATLRAQQLGHEMAQRLEDIKQHLPILVTGEQRQGYAFGVGLGKGLMEYPEAVVDDILSLLGEAGKDGNPSLLCGFVSAIHSRHGSLVSKVLDTIASRPELGAHLVPVSCSTKLKKSDLDRLLDSAGAGRTTVFSLRGLSYGRVLSHLPPETITGFCDRVCELGEEGVWASLDILYMYFYPEEDRWLACKGCFRRILMSPSLQFDKARGGLDDYHWEEVAEKLLALSPDDTEFLLHIVKTSLRLPSSYDFAGNFEDSMRKALKAAISVYPELVWPIVGDELLRSSPAQQWELSMLIKERIGEGGPHSIISELPVTYLMDWCEQNGDKAAAVLANVAPVFKEEEHGRLTWHPIAEALLANYSDDDEVLSGMWANMFPECGFTGELIELWQMQIAALSELSEQASTNISRWAKDCIVCLCEQIERVRRE